MARVALAMGAFAIAAVGACTAAFPLSALRPELDGGSSDAASDSATDAADPCSEPGLIAYYRFEDRTPDIARNCVPDGGLDIVLVKDAILVDGGRTGQALSITSDTGYGQILGMHPVLAQGPITVAVWVKGGDAEGRILSNRVRLDGGDSASVDLALEGENGRPRGFGFYVSSGVHAYYLSDAGVPLDRWIHLVGVHRQAPGSGRTEIWLDGKLLIDVAESRELSTLPPRVGNDYRGVFGLGGMIDDLRVYDRALTQAEIEALGKR
jgi:hypothetical protein